MEQAAVGFERDIRPLFREKDIDSMRPLPDLSAVPAANTGEAFRHPFRFAP
jgi:hypothetical protein